MWGKGLDVGFNFYIAAGHRLRSSVVSGFVVSSCGAGCGWGGDEYYVSLSGEVVAIDRNEARL